MDEETNKTEQDEEIDSLKTELADRDMRIDELKAENLLLLETLKEIYEIAKKQI